MTFLKAEMFKFFIFVGLGLGMGLLTAQVSNQQGLNPEITSNVAFNPEQKYTVSVVPDPIFPSFKLDITNFDKIDRQIRYSIEVFDDRGSLRFAGRATRSIVENLEKNQNRHGT